MALLCGPMISFVKINPGNERQTRKGFGSIASLSIKCQSGLQIPDCFVRIILLLAQVPQRDSSSRFIPASLGPFGGREGLSEIFFPSPLVSPNHERIAKIYESLRA